MAELDASQLEEIHPLFDPVAFQRDNPDPKVEAYRLTEQELQDRGMDVSLIRKTINDKARAHKDPPP